MAIVRVQGDRKNSGSVSTDTQTVTSSTSGSTWLIGIRAGNSTDADVVTGLTLGSSSFSAVRRQRQAADHNLLCYILENGPASQTTLTLTFSGVFTMRWGYAEITGCATSSSVEQQNSTSSSGTAPASGSVTTVVANQFLFACGSSQNSTDWALGSGWGNLKGNGDKYAQEDQIVSVASTYNGDFTITSDQWAAMIVTLKEAGGGGGTNWGPLLGLQNNRLVVAN